MRRIVIGLALLAGTTDVAGAVHPVAAVIVLPARPAEPLPPPAAAVNPPASPGTGQGWLVATAAFALLGFGMRSRPRASSHAIG